LRVESNPSHLKVALMGNVFLFVFRPILYDVQWLIVAFGSWFVADY
jgi:hypothetical protein